MQKHSALLCHKKKLKQIFCLTIDTDNSIPKKSNLAEKHKAQT